MRLANGIFVSRVFGATAEGGGSNREETLLTHKSSRQAALKKRASIPSFVGQFHCCRAAESAKLYPLS